MQRSEIEIMAPVGSYEALAAAIQAGADSVYFGVGKLNMRSASAANFTLDDLAKIVATAHAAGVKTYLTVNTIVYEDEMLTVHEVIDRAKAEGIDAIIATDFAAILYARRIGVEVHISTQSNISNSETVKFFSQWADTVVLARELTLEQVAQIHRQIVENDIRGPRGELVGIEMFAHGALCMSISGKCYLSLYETNCSANRGACRQLCRRKYTVTDTETGAALDIDGRYVLSPKDLCTVDFLDRFIEGRARGAEYVKRVVSCYDEALRAIEAGTYTPALAAGLDGVMVGTRFLMAAETDIGPHLRQAVMDAKETDTVLTQTSIRNALRSLKTQEALHIIDFEKTHHPTLEELYPLIRGTVTKAAYEKDDPQAAQIAMGQVLGRIHDVKPAAQIIQDMMDELYAMHRRVSNML